MVYKQSGNALFLHTANTLVAVNSIATLSREEASTLFLPLESPSLLISLLALEPPSVQATFG